MNGNQMSGEMNKHDVDYSISEKDKMLIKKFVYYTSEIDKTYFILYKYTFWLYIFISFTRQKYYNCSLENFKYSYMIICFKFHNKLKISF